MRTEIDKETTLSRDYEGKVMEHYTQVAQATGLAASCTMEDEYIRDGETRAIHRLVELASKTTAGTLRVLDVGCGNGYTLRTLAERIRNGGIAGSIELLGIEKNPDLNRLAIRMNEGLPAAISGGDILRAETLKVDRASVDVCISQRVIINLMDLADQRAALANLISLVKPGGYLLFIECFQEGLDNLNDARKEFNLGPNTPAAHNLYLPPDFFNISELIEASPEHWNVPATLFSTHYYVQRVLQSALRGSVIDRNSNFVRFFSEALPVAVGDYSPIRIHCFRKTKA